jgi:hypothetical protein
MATLKDALFFAIRRNLYYTVVRVTSLKGRRRWYGSDCSRDYEPTNGTTDQLLARFRTEAAANEARAAIKAIDVKYDAQIDQLQQGISNLRRQAGREIRDCLENNKEALRDG